MSLTVMSLIVYGAGGHAAVVVDVARTIQPDREIVVFDADPARDPVLGLVVQSGLPDPAVLSPAGYEVIVAIGNCMARKTVANQLGALGYPMATLIHPRACISAAAKIGTGTVVCANAVVNPRARVAQGCIINTNATIEHDCNIAPFCHISPGAVLAGGVSLGAQSWIGANATVRETCHIGAHVIVGAGSFVNTDLASDATYFGSPARRAK
jgi:sugar O-acyltransferase (sialic acid O-acetyltransferase NeuD family)